MKTQSHKALPAIVEIYIKAYDKNVTLTESFNLVVNELNMFIQSNKVMIQFWRFFGFFLLLFTVHITVMLKLIFHSRDPHWRTVSSPWLQEAKGQHCCACWHENIPDEAISAEGGTGRTIILCLFPPWLHGKVACVKRRIWIDEEEEEEELKKTVMNKGRLIPTKITMVLIFYIVCVFVYVCCDVVFVYRWVCWLH